MMPMVPNKNRSTVAAEKAHDLVEQLRRSNRKADPGAEFHVKEADYRALENQLTRKLRKRAA
jgi:hypothetical protein